MKALFIAALILVSAVPRTNAQHASKSWQNALERAKRNETFGIRLESYKVKDTLRTDDDVRRIIDGWFDDDDSRDTTGLRHSGYTGLVDHARMSGISNAQRG